LIVHGVTLTVSSAEPSQSNFDVYALRLNAGSNNNVDLYVDNVMVASDAKQTSEEILCRFGVKLVLRTGFNSFKCNF